MAARSKETKTPESEIGLVVPETGLVPSEETSIYVPQDAEIDRLIEMLSQPTQGLTYEEYTDSIRKRQEAVDQRLFRCGVETLRRFFERIRYFEEKRSVKPDLSMLDFSGKILSGLYLPGANLEKLIITGADVTGGELTGANLSDSIATMAILRGVIAAGAIFNNAIMTQADLAGGRFMGCTFVNTVMTDVKVDEQTNFAGAVFIGTYFGKADLSRTNTVGAIFRSLKP